MNLLLRVTTLSLWLVCLACGEDVHTPALLDTGSTESSSALLSQASFATRLAAAMNSTANNALLAPDNILHTLSLAAAGAAGSTAVELQAILNGYEPDTEIDGNDRALNALHSAYGVWLQPNQPLAETYRITAMHDLHATVAHVDFRDPETARQTINQRMALDSDGRVADLIPSGALHPETRFVLLGGVTLSAAWAQPFAARNSRASQCFDAEGSLHACTMMHQIGTFAYAHADGYTAVELAYANSDLSMLLMLPDADAAAMPSESSLQSIAAALHETSLAISLPKFALSTRVPLREPLRRLGMQQAFTPGRANFSALSPESDLFISDILHQATLRVDEAGTEASAGTAVVIGVTSAPEVNVVFDRPFSFLLHHRHNGTIHFMGQVNTPGHL